MGAGAGGVGVVGGVAPVGICTIGELEELLPPPPQDESNTHAANALKRFSFT